MNADSEMTRKLMERFNTAFQQHRPEDLDDLIGEGCVLENTAPAPMEHATKGVRPASISGKGLRPPRTLFSKKRTYGRTKTVGSSAGNFAGAKTELTGYAA